MKIRSFFDIISDAKDVVEFFSGVETVPQMISKLERLKRHETDDLLICVESLKISIESALEDTLEMSGDIDGDTEEEMNDSEFAEMTDTELAELEDRKSVV